MFKSITQFFLTWNKAPKANSSIRCNW